MIEMAVNAPYANAAQPIVLRMVDLLSFMNRLLLFFFTMGTVDTAMYCILSHRRGNVLYRRGHLHPDLRSRRPALMRNYAMSAEQVSFFTALQLRPTPCSLAHCSKALRISGMSCSLVDQLTKAARMAGFPAKKVGVSNTRPSSLSASRK